MTNCKDGARNDINMGVAIAQMSRGSRENPGQTREHKTNDDKPFIRTAYGCH